MSAQRLVHKRSWHLYASQAKPKMTQISINRSMVRHIAKRILFSSNREQTIGTGDNMDGSWKHSAEQKKPDTQNTICYIILLKLNSRKAKLIYRHRVMERRWAVSSCWGWGSGQSLKSNAYEGTVWHEIYIFCFLIVMVMSQNSSNYMHLILCKLYLKRVFSVCFCFNLRESNCPITYDSTCHEIRSQGRIFPATEMTNLHCQEDSGLLLLLGAERDTFWHPCNTLWHPLELFCLLLTVNT